MNKLNAASAGQVSIDERERVDGGKDQTNRDLDVRWNHFGKVKDRGVTPIDVGEQRLPYAVAWMRGLRGRQLELDMSPPNQKAFGKLAAKKGHQRRGLGIVQNDDVRRR